MSDINWKFVSQNVLFSFIAIFLFLVGVSIFSTIYYFVSLTIKLNNIRNKLVAKERANIAKYGKRDKSRNKPDIVAYVNPLDQGDSPKQVGGSNETITTIRGSNESMKDSTNVVNLKPTVSGQSKSQQKTDPSFV